MNINYIIETYKWSIYVTKPIDIETALQMKLDKEIVVDWCIISSSSIESIKPISRYTKYMLKDKITPFDLRRLIDTWVIDKDIFINLPIHDNANSYKKLELWQRSLEQNDRWNNKLMNTWL